MGNKKRVAIYVRVSKKGVLSKHSLLAQKTYLKNYALKHEDWELVDIYSDYGRSGTNTLRKDYLELLDKCYDNKIDILLTKSVSRLMRNKLEMTRILNKFTELGIEIVFESENMSSKNPYDRYRLALLATQAEMMAREASIKQKWRIRHMFLQGKTTVGRMLGYRLKDGVLTIVPEEAEIVRIIYQLYLDGYGKSRIAKELNRLRIKPVYSDIWQEGPIHKILTNEKYAGKMLLQKTYREDFRTKKSKINHGERPQYYVENSHEAIIDKDTFDRVQETIRNRAQKSKVISYENQVPHLFSGFIKCGVCGYRFRYKNTNFKYKPHDVWVCNSFNFLGKGSCPAKQIREEILIEKTKEVLHMEKGEALTRDILQNKVELITANPNNELIYHLKDGSIVFIKWENRSRRDSWTPEMREEARQRAIEQRQGRKKDKKKIL